MFHLPTLSNEITELRLTVRREYRTLTREELEKELVKVREKGDIYRWLFIEEILDN
jgi:hypothetical protein